jgi:DNA sulfur modification protein DndB
MTKVVLSEDTAKLVGCVGLSSRREVFLGFAAASLLHRLSFADVLDEETGRGYQRRFTPQHSLDFRKYIQQEHSSTIPLTFNLRPREDKAWSIARSSSPQAELTLKLNEGKLLTQVDCQHRLGHLNDLDISLPFMCYIGLSEREEMEIFNVINSKAKGLSTSLLDFHDATLTSDLAKERPELFIALHLNNSPSSPWYRQLDLGGTTTSGMTRRASLRMMQTAVRRLLSQTKALRNRKAEEVAQMILDFWSAVALVSQEAWDAPRKHLICKGVGVHALMGIAADLIIERREVCDKRYFVNQLSAFMSDVDWKANGSLAGLGGQGGVKSAISILRAARSKSSSIRIING